MPGKPREHLRALVRRRDFLDKEVVRAKAEGYSPQEYSYDAAELRALNWAIEELSKRD